MSNVAQGVVYKIFNKESKQGQTIYSIKLDGNDTYYGCFTNKPACGPGDEVSFNYRVSGNFSNADVASLKVLNKGSGEAPAPAAQSSQRKGGGGSRDDYWEEKERYDREVRQQLIMLQNATTCATTLVAAALQKDVLPVGSKAKADKFELMLAYTRKVRDTLYADYMEAKLTLERGETLRIDEIDQAQKDARDSIRKMSEADKAAILHQESANAAQSTQQEEDQWEEDTPF